MGNTCVLPTRRGPSNERPRGQETTFGEGEGCEAKPQSFGARGTGTFRHPLLSSCHDHCRGVCLFELGRAEDPGFTFKLFTVTAAWPGATAPEMQDLVAEPLEHPMQQLTYYDHVDTFTRPGLAFLTVTLKDYTPPEDVQEEYYQGR